jgi:hypothetical protein
VAAVDDCADRAIAQARPGPPFGPVMYPSSEIVMPAFTFVIDVQRV